MTGTLDVGGHRRFAIIAVAFALGVFSATTIRADVRLTTLSRQLPELGAVAARVAELELVLTSRLATIDTETRRGLGWYTVDQTGQPLAGSFVDGYRVHLSPTRRMVETAPPEGQPGYEVLVVDAPEGTSNGTAREGHLYYRRDDWVGPRSVELWLSASADQPPSMVVDWRGGPRVTMAGGGYEVRMDGDDALSYYTIPWFPGHGELTLSPRLMAAICGPSTEVEASQVGVFLDELSEEGGNTYVLRALSAAVDAGLDLRDDGALGAFAASWMRRIIGLDGWRRDRRLEAAAYAHSRAVVESGLVDVLLGALGAGGDDDETFLSFHSETPDMPGFTGEHPYQRAASAGYPHEAVGENGNFGTDVVSAAYGWFVSVYHRRPWLFREVTEVGLAAYPPGEAGRNAVTMNYASPPSGAPSPRRYTVVPAPGEEYVPAAWSGMEAPNPVPERRDPDWAERVGLPQPTGSHLAPLGPPISIYVPGGSAASGRFELRDDRGHLVETTKVEVWADDRFYETIPVRPLTPGRSYHATYDGPYGSFTWSFRTAPHPPLNSVTVELAARLAESLASVRSTATPTFDRIAAGTGLPVEFSAGGGTVRVYPYDFVVAIPREFTPALVPEAPWLLRFSRPNPWASVEVVWHNLGYSRDLEAFWETIQPREWAWEHAETARLQIIDSTGAERPVILGRWRMDDGRDAYVIASIVAERGVSVWSYGLTRNEATRLAGAIAPTAE